MERSLERSSSGMAFVSRGGSTHKAITLDLMLRTFMNSPDFQPQNPRMWEGIARLVPGTTPQQCVQRWEELRSSSRMITRDLSLVSARGKPVISPQLDHTTGRRNTIPLIKSPHIGERYQFTSVSASELPPIIPIESRPSSVKDPIYDQYRGSVNRYRMNSGGQFTASFCQSHIYGNKKKEEEIEENEENGDHTTAAYNNNNNNNTDEDNSYSNTTQCMTVEQQNSVETVIIPKVNTTNLLTNPPLKENEQNIMLIHVKDEMKKINKDFQCPRHILTKEMRYFDDYLSSSSTGSHWEEVDISVHCDVSVFHWLMSYAKRGMREGPTGELLDTPLEPPKLVPTNTVSILISSDFLKMDTLVEECIVYCCEHLSDVVGSPSNMACIGDHLLIRMVQKLEPLEIENVNDPKDKIKNKLYMYMVERMCCNSYSQPQCPVNGATLFRCIHCDCLLTKEQQFVFPCANHRLKVDRNGRIVYQHESETDWDINKYISELKKKGLKWRDIYWRIWGIINWCHCTVCGEPIQCRNISNCAYHPGIPITITTTTSTTTNTASTTCYSCCSQPLSSFSPLLPVKKGCCFKDHTIDSLSSDKVSSVQNVLILMKEAVSITDEKSMIQSRVSMSCLFSDGHKRHHPNCLKNSAGSVMKPQRSSLSRPYSTSTMSRILPELSDETKQCSNNNNNISVKKHNRLRRATLEDEESSVSSHTSSSSELEEDDDNDDRSKRKCIKLKMSQRTSQKKTIKKPKSVLRSRSSERSMAEWEWDCGKSVRWNQDMQRDNDDKRISVLKQQLQKLTTTTNNKETKSSKIVDGYNGGIFCQIEAQFRTQRMAANGLGSSRQSGHRSLRKNNSQYSFRQ